MEESTSDHFLCVEVTNKTLLGLRNFERLESILQFAESVCKSKTHDPKKQLSNVVVVSVVMTPICLKFMFLFPNKL